MLPEPTSAASSRPCSKVMAVPAQDSNRTMLAILALSVVSLLAIGTQALAQSLTPPMPANAHAKSYGDGWECDRSFTVVEDQCIAIIVPSNAYLTNRVYGSGWECHHGFEEIEGVSCTQVFVPEDGYLDASGKRWHCTRGYRQIGETCEQIELPEHAYLSDDTYGSDWQCDRGYEKTADTCALIVVPDNAYLNSATYGTPWTCERGFSEVRGICEAVIIPKNAYFVAAIYGVGWKCERGFVASGEACTTLVVPENAHLDRSGNQWDCNRNFQRSKGHCIKGD